MLTLYGRLNSSNGQKISWTLAELGLGYRNVAVGGSFGGLDGPRFRALNPHGMIPVDDDDGAVIWVSDAIVAYLGARDGAGGFWPDDPVERARADQWIF